MHSYTSTEDRIRSRRKSISNRELLIAAGKGDVETVKRLFNEEVDINFEDRDGNTPLHYAAEEGHNKIVNLLIHQKTIETNKENSNCETAFDIAKRFNRSEIIELLGGAQIKETNALLAKELEYFILPVRTKIEELTCTNETLSRNYNASLDQKDINDVLKFKYANDENDKMFEAIKWKQLSEKIQQFKESSKNVCTLIIDLGYHNWITLLVVAICREENRFEAYYANSNRAALDVFKYNVKKLVGIDEQNELLSLQSQEYVNNLDSGVLALENADIINCCLNNKFKSKNELKITSQYRNNEFIEYVSSELIKQTINVDEKRKLIAYILNEKKRTEDKIKYCLKNLEVLNKNAKNMTVFSHKEANMFVRFLETFALEDTYIGVSDKKQKRTLTKHLTNLKKAYFRKYYLDEDFKLITDARNTILHNNKILEPEDFHRFASKNIKELKTFFISMEKFTKGVHGKIINSQTQEPPIPCSDFLNSLNNHECIGKNGDLLEVFSAFVHDIYKPHKQINQDMLEKMLFDLTVNILPVLENQKENVGFLSTTRNNLIHNFQKYSEKERLEEIKKLTFLKSNLFKYYYSKTIHDVLTKIKPKEACKTIEGKFKETLTNFEVKFGNKHHVVVSEMEGENNFEYVFEESVFPKKDESTKTLVDQYLKYMIFIDNEERVEDIDDVNDEIAGGSQYKKLSDKERRETFEEFIKLKQMYKQPKPNTDQILHQQWEIIKTKLKAKLEIDYGISGDLFDDVVNSYVYHNNELNEEDTAIAHYLTNILRVLKSIMNNNPKLSIQEIISIYDHFVKSTSLFDLDQCQGLLKQKIQKKTYVETVLNGLPKREFVKLSITHKQHFCINTYQVISNMLKVFYSAYHKYQIKFNNIENAFSDETFLNYLVDREVKFDETSEKFQYKNFEKLYLIIKKLLKIEYTAPYIASLIIKTQCDDVVEKDDLIHLTEILLQKDSCITYLDKLLEIQIENENFNHYEEVCKQIFNKNVNIKDLGIIFKNPKHVNGIFSIINKNIDEMDAIKKGKVKEILKLLNSIACELYFDYDHGVALEILINQDVKNVRKNICKNGLDIVEIEASYQIAKLKNKNGKHKEALEILKEEICKFTTNNICNSHYILILEEIAYIYRKLKQYNESCEKYNELYNAIVKFVLGFENINLYNKSTKDIDIRILKSDKHKELLSSLKKHNSTNYFDILHVQRGFALTLFKSNANEREIALKIQEKVYSLTKHNLKVNNENAIPIYAMQSIAFLHSEIGRAQKNVDAIRHHQTALVWNIKALIEQKDKHGSYHPIILRRIQAIVLNLYNIALAYKRLGSKKKSDPAIATQYYYKAVNALKMVNKLNEHVKTIENNYKRVKQMWFWDLNNVQIKTFSISPNCLKILSKDLQNATKQYEKLLLLIKKYKKNKKGKKGKKFKKGTKID